MNFKTKWIIYLSSEKCHSEANCYNSIKCVLKINLRLLFELSQYCYFPTFISGSPIPHGPAVAQSLVSCTLRNLEAAITPVLRLSVVSAKLSTAKSAALLHLRDYIKLISKL